MARLDFDVDGIHVMVRNPDEAFVVLGTDEESVSMPLRTLYEITKQLHEKWGDLSPAMTPLELEMLEALRRLFFAVPGGESVGEMAARQVAREVIAKAEAALDV
jgi:hypothetical protein